MIIVSETNIMKLHESVLVQCTLICTNSFDQLPAEQLQAFTVIFLIEKKSGKFRLTHMTLP